MVHPVPRLRRGAWHAPDTRHAFFALSLRQQVVADAPEQQLQPLSWQRFCTDQCGEPALERRKHGLYYAVLVVRLFKGIFSPRRCLSPIIDFTTVRAANSDPAHRNGAPTLFLFAAATSSCLCGSSRMINAWPRLTYFSLSVI